MKVNVYQTVEFSDQQRVTLARLLDGPDGKKREATRDEIKTFLWEHGRHWEANLGVPAVQEDTSAAASEEEDLLGIGELDDDNLL